MFLQFQILDNVRIQYKGGVLIGEIRWLQFKLNPKSMSNSNLPTIFRKVPKGSKKDKIASSELVLSQCVRSLAIVAPEAFSKRPIRFFNRRSKNEIIVADLKSI